MLLFLDYLVLPQRAVIALRLPFARGVLAGHTIVASRLRCHHLRLARRAIDAIGLPCTVLVTACGTLGARLRRD